MEQTEIAKWKKKNEDVERLLKQYDDMLLKTPSNAPQLIKHWENYLKPLIEIKTYVEVKVKDCFSEITKQRMGIMRNNEAGKEDSSTTAED
jgi:hypothetical protein